MSFWISIFSQPIHTLDNYIPCGTAYTGGCDKKSSAHARLSQDELLGMSGVQIRAHLHNNSAWLV